jgi:hypoxanthine-guanine phosphoribosyltransferase
VQGDLERVVFDEPTILRRLDEIAAQISKDYRNLSCIGALLKELVK